MRDHPRGRLAGWILLALAGLAIAVALSVAASNLSTQPIGLTGEPLRAGDRLAPVSATRTTPATGKKKAKPKSTKTVTAPAQTQTATAPVPTTTSNSGTGGADGDDHGSGRHRDGDDD